MAQITAPKGTCDVLPQESYKWQYLESVMREAGRRYGYEEARFPTFEHTELFQRGVGDATDVVQKEMYTFNDKGGRSITLRPEGTASVVRMVLEHGLYGGLLPLKTFYIIPCFRYEKPQAGRLREFHQFGVEVFGAADPAADCEVIALGAHILRTLGIGGVTLEINSIGCRECRAAYKAALVEYYAQFKDRLCETCLGRLETNPLRLLDCKSPVCSALKAGAPSILDYLCGDCADHFAKVRKGLDALGVDYAVNPFIVRGLDYYNRTVFEFTSSQIGAQAAVFGGGRYDGLAEDLGGAPLSGLGFAMGLERLLLLMENTGVDIPRPAGPDLFLAALGPRAAARAATIADGLRGRGLSCVTDLCGRSLKAQMKYAGKIGSRYAAILGDDELDRGVAALRDLAKSEQAEVPLDKLYEYITER